MIFIIGGVILLGIVLWAMPLLFARGRLNDSSKHPKEGQHRDTDSATRNSDSFGICTVCDSVGPLFHQNGRCVCIHCLELRKESKL